MGFNSFFVGDLAAAEQQRLAEEQYALDRYNSNPAYWEEQARLANPNFPNIMGEDFTNQYYTQLAQDLAGTEGMRAAALQSIAHDGGIDSDIGDFLGDVGTVALGTAAFGVGGATGAAAATGNIDSGSQLLDYAALDAGGLAAGAGLASAGLGATAPTAGTAGAGGTTTGLGSLAGGGGTLVDAATSGDPYGGSTMWPDDSVFGGDPYGGTMWPDDSTPYTGGGGGTSWDQFGNWAMQNLAPNAMGPNWGDVGLGLLQYQGQRKFQDDIINTMNRAVDRADPFYGERPFYQNQFKQMNTDPNYFQNDAALNAMQNSAMRGVAAQDVSKGYLGSGNILHDLTRTGTETAANYILPRMDMSAKAAGAYNDPARAGQIMSQMGPIAAGAGIAQNQTLGNTIQMARTGSSSGSLGNPFPTLANWASQQNWSL